jgi:hypothetical protein
LDLRIRQALIGSFFLATLKIEERSMKLGVLMVAIIDPFLTTQYQAFIRPLPFPIRESICFFVKPKK